MLNSVMLIGVGVEVTPRRDAGFARDPVTVTGLAPIQRSAWKGYSAHFALTAF
jgi:hypothetical protein